MSISPKMIRSQILQAKRTELVERQAHMKKLAIMSSPEFQEWWIARQHISPVPSDPYRAFMIDIALKARLASRDVWRTRTNWSDYPPVDYPRGMPRGRMPSRRRQIKYFGEAIPKAARPVKRTPFEREIETEMGVLSEKYHVPIPKIFFEPTLPTRESYYYAGYPVVGTFPYIRLGTKEQKIGVPTRAIIKAVFKHELGHHIHYAYGGNIAEAIGIRVPARAAQKIERERTAWRIAKPHLTEMRPLQMWEKKFALGTYLGTTKGIVRM